MGHECGVYLVCVFSLCGAREKNKLGECSEYPSVSTNDRQGSRQRGGRGAAYMYWGDLLVRDEMSVPRGDWTSDRALRHRSLSLFNPSYRTWQQSSHVVNRSQWMGPSSSYHKIYYARMNYSLIFHLHN